MTTDRRDLGVWHRVSAGALCLLILPGILGIAKAGAQGGGDHGDNADAFTPPSFTPPAAVNAVAPELQDVQGRLETRLRFDPILEVNPNRGSLSTVIPIDLPPTLAGLPPLELVYYHNDPRNVGLGIGWRWNLPTIRPNARPVERAPYVTEGLLGAHELTPTEEDLGPIAGTIRDAWAACGGAMLPPEVLLEPFRPLVDETAHLWVRIGGGAEGWVALTLDGQRWLFSPRGAPRCFADRLRHAVHLDWSEGVLREIRDPNSGWRAELTYGGRQRFAQWTPQGWQQQPMGLTGVRFILDGEEPRQLIVTNQEGYLVRATWQGGLVPLFHGSYQRPELVRSDVPNDLRRHDDKVAVMLVPGVLEWRKQEREELYLDLNGDGRTDRLRFDWQSAEDRLGEAWAGLKWSSRGDIETKHGAYDAHLAGIRVPSIVEMAVASSPEEPAAWWIDRSLEFASRWGAQPVSFYVDPYQRHRATEKDLQPQVLENGFFFVDLNGDGRRDLVFCPGDRELSRNRPTVAVDPIRRGGDTTLRSHSNLALTVMSWFLPLRTAAFRPADPFSRNGSPPLILLQAADGPRIESLWAARRDTSTPAERVNFLTEASRWAALPDPGAKCHQDSVFLDANHDGRTDILTGRTLYLMGDLSGQEPGADFLAVPVDPGEFFAPGDAAPDLEDTQMILVDTDGDGRLEVRQARAAFNDPESGRLLLVRNGRTELLEQPPQQALLTVLHSPFGGRIEVRYGFEQGRWVIRTLRRDPNLPETPAEARQPVVTHSYGYRSPLRDPHRGVLIGFADTEERIEVDDLRAAPRVVDRQFIRDVGYDVVLFNSRGRLNGRLLVERVRPADGAGSLVERRWSHLVGADLGGFRIWPYFERFEESRRTPAASIIDDRRLALQRPTEWQSTARGDWLFPLRVETREEGKGLPSRHSDALLEAVRVREIDYRANDRMYLRVLAREEVRDKDGRRFRQPLEVEVDPDTFLPRSACRGERCDEWAFDSDGRLIRALTPLGGERRWAYEGGAPLPLSTTGADGTEVHDYEPLTGRLRSLTTLRGARWRWSYSVDGLLLGVAVQPAMDQPEQAFYRLEAPLERCDPGAVICQLERRLQIHQEEMWSRLELDGWGRVESVVQPDGDRLRRSGRTLYGEADKPLALSLPVWGDRDVSTPFRKWRRDALGRPIEEQHADPTKLETEYWGSCRQTNLNRRLQEGSCDSALGNRLREWRGSERLLLETSASGDYLALPSLGISWELNEHAEVVGSQSADAKSPGAVEWQPIRRQIEDGGRIVRNDQGFTWHFDQEGRLGSTERRGGIRATDLYETRQYDRGRLAVASLRSGDGRVAWRREVRHDPLGHPAGWKVGSISKEIENDIWGRPQSMSVSHGSGAANRLRYEYRDGRLAAIQPIVESVRRDLLGNLVEVRWTNGVRMLRRYVQPLTQRPRLIQVWAADKAELWSETLVENPGTQQIEERTTRSVLSRRSDRFEYHPETYQLLNQLPGASQRDAFGRLQFEGGSRLEWNDQNLSAAGKTSFYYDFEGRVAAACPKGNRSSECTLVLDDDLVSIGGELAQVVLLETLPVAVVLRGVAYPVIADHLGSIRALISADGRTLLWERHFDAWGRKEVHLGEAADGLPGPSAAVLERGTVWSFAGLRDLGPPGTDLYWSRSRVYSPRAGEWLSPDSTLLWDPAALAADGGNWFPVRYSRNDPLHYVDPTGGSAIFVAGVLTAGVLAYKAYDFFSAVGENLNTTIAVQAKIKELDFVEDADQIAELKELYVRFQQDFVEDQVLMGAHEDRQERFQREFNEINEKYEGGDQGWDDQEMDLH